MEVAKRAAYVTFLPVAFVTGLATFSVGTLTGMAGGLVGGVAISLYDCGKYIATGRSVDKYKYFGKYVDDYYTAVETVARMPVALLEKNLISIPASRRAREDQEDPSDTDMKAAFGTQASLKKSVKLL